MALNLIIFRERIVEGLMQYQLTTSTRRRTCNHRQIDVLCALEWRHLVSAAVRHHA